jgi:hypothetical protein
VGNMNKNEIKEKNKNKERKDLFFPAASHSARQ